MAPAFGVYPVADAQSAGDEVSSTYEGRHVTITESDLIHPTHTDGFVNKGDPVFFAAGATLEEVGVGVAFTSAAAATDLVAIDTEGIWILDVVAQDDDGNSAVAGGQQIYINRTTGVLSKIRNLQSHVRFGYALGVISAGNTDTIAVKIHFDPSDPEALVGTSGTNHSSAKAGHSFREYRYTASNVAGDHRGLYMALTLTGAGASGEALRGRLVVDAAVAGGAHGIHGGIEFESEGSITGLGVGVRATYLAKDAAAAGTISGGMSELFAGGASTDYGAATMHSIHRFVNDGEATGLATADNVFEFSGLTATQWAGNTDVPTRALRVIINGDVRYIMVSEAQS